MNKLKVAFLDRDGTIIKDYDEEEWKRKTEPEFLNGSIDALKKIRSMNYEIIIITNQEIINKKLISLGQYYKFTDKLLEKLKENNIQVLDILYCPHTDEEKCNCRKPKPGMVLKACEKYNIDMNKSFVVGDTRSDEGLVEYFKLKFFGVNYSPENKNNLRVNSLLDIIKYIK